MQPVVGGEVSIMMPIVSDIDLFHFDEGRDSFEDHGQANGDTLWYARDFMQWLGYSSYASFQKAVNTAIGVCSTLGIPVVENFVQVTRNIDGHEVNDHKISRFACYLVAMNGDVKKTHVARAQAYFATLAQSFQNYIGQAQDVERVAIREDVSERESVLSSVAKRAGVTNYAFFQNAGYRGLYNMNINALRKRKGLPARRSPLDFMDKRELAANLFRITETEAKIQTDGVRGQSALERTAEDVGGSVRGLMLKHTGTPPEQLQPAPDIRKVRTDLKATNREFRKLDKPKKP